MSISVVPAAAAAARDKQIGHKKKKPIKKPEDEQVTQGHEHAADADKAQFQGERHDDKDAPGLGGASFRAALASASALQGADSAGGGSSSDSSDGKNNDALLIGGAVLLLGGGIALAAGGGGGGSSPTPTPTNSAPTFAAATQAVTTAEDTKLTVTAAATDANGDTLTYAVGTQSTKGTITVDGGGKFTYTPNANYNGTDSFTVTVSDGKGGTATQTINITVTAVNDAPVYAAATQAVTGNEDTAIAFTAAATDVDGDTLTYTATGAKNGTVTVAEGGKFTYTPNANFNGTETIVVTAKDAGGLTATQTVTVTVAAVNDAPTFAAATQTVNGSEDTVITFTSAATDVDGDALTYTATGAKNGTVAIAADGKVTYTPNADYNGTETIVVTAKDPGGLTATQTVTVNVANVAETRTIDVGTNTQAQTFNAAGDDFKFTDNSAVATNVVINNLGAGDKIEVTAASTDYSFTSVGNDIQVTYNNTAAGVLNTIVLTGLAKNGGFVFNEATAEAVAGFDFFSALTQPGGNGSGDGIAALGGNLDDDDDANVLTRATTSALNGNISFTENAAIANNIAITDFTNGDTISVTGAPTSAYSFGTTGTGGHDIQIVYNNSGVVSQIVLIGANPTGAVITNEATAEAAVGSDFFKAAAPTTPGTLQTIDNGTALATVNAAAAALNFTDDAAVATNVLITGFSNNDLITVTGAKSTDYNFTQDAVDTKDLKISYTNNGIANSIVLDDVIVHAGFIQTYEQAVAAVGYNFMNFT